MSSTDNSILFSNLSLSSFECATCGLAFSLSLFLAKKKGTTTTLFSPFLSSSSRSDKVSRKSPREEDNAQRGRCVFVLVKSKSVNGVQKRKEERDDSVLIGEEIQLGFRVFFWFRVLFVNVLFFSSLLLLLSFVNSCF